MALQYRPNLLALCLLTLSTISIKLPAHAADAPQKNVVYSKVDDQELALDVFGAAPGEKKPAVIFLHGGGWIGGSRHDMDAPASYVAGKGYVSFTVSYRLVKDGKNRYPAQIDDVQKAVRWIRAHAADYGVNPDKIGALGASAGGHLVALLGTTDTLHNTDPELSKYSSRVQCVVDLYGPTNFTTFPPGADLEHPSDGMKLVANFLGPLPENAVNYPEASPITHVDKTSAPFLIFHGGKDTLVPVEQSKELDAALHKVGVESKLIVFPDAGHGYTDPVLIFQTTNAALEFFDRHLKN